MRIGIDATALPPQLLGAGNYVVDLTNALFRVDTANEYVVFVKPMHTALFETSGRARVLPIALPGRLARIVWEQTVLPAQAHALRLDVLHSPHYTMPFALNCASVVTFHDMIFFLYPEMHQAYKRIFFQSMIQLSARRARAIVADSENTRQDILAVLKLDAAKVTAIPLGVSASYRPIADTALLENIKHKYHLPDKFILYVGAFEPRKNLPTLVRAFKSLVERGIARTLVMVGRKGWTYDELFRTVQSLGLAERVIFTGYVPEDDLPFLYGAADLFVYPSIYEGFGLPVLEAMACGLPVITSNVASLSEIVGPAGILVNPHDAEELRDAMQRLLTDRALRDELRTRALERARSFSWEQTARQTCTVYESAVRKT